MNRTLETYGSNSLKSHIASGSHPKFYFKNYFSKKVPIFRHTPWRVPQKKTSPAFAGYTVIGIPEEAFARGDLALDEQSISKIPGGWLKCWVIQ